MVDWTWCGGERLHGILRLWGAEAKARCYHQEITAEAVIFDRALRDGVGLLAGRV
jgi:hypothetical protein